MPSTKHYDLDIDATLGGNNASDNVISSQKAVKSYVDNNIPDVSVYQLIAQNMTTLSASGTITLSDNTINKISATGAVTFSLPTITDLTKFHQIFVQLNMSSAQTISLGTSYYFNKVQPDLSAAGTYNIYYEYDNDAGHWVVGTLPKGTA